MTPGRAHVEDDARRLLPLLERKVAADLTQHDGLHRPSSSPGASRGTPRRPPGRPPTLRHAANACTSRSSLARVARVVEELLDLADRVRALPVERLDVPRDPFLQVVDDELDEPPRLGRFAPGCARRTSISQRARPGRDQAAARAGCRRRPGSRPRLTSGKPSWASRVRDPEVAGERDLEPAAEAVAVDRGDHRDRRPPRSGRRPAGCRRAGRRPPAPPTKPLMSAPAENARSPRPRSTTT